MQPQAFPPLVEAFLVIDQPRQRLVHWTQALAPLDDGRAPPLASVTTYYDPAADQALLQLRYDELALGGERLGFVVEVALLAEIGMIQPAELSDGDRRRFLGERLARCTLQVADQRSVVASLSELVRRMRELKVVPRSPPPIPLAARGSLRPREAADDPVLQVQPRSTRDDLTDLLQPVDSARPRSPSPDVVARASINVDTVEMSPSELQRIVAEGLAGGTSQVMSVAIGEPPRRTARSRSPSNFGTEPYLPAAPQPAAPDVIHARYLRSGRWVPIRIGALSLRGAALMAGALPRLHDNVDVALSYGEHRALVRGPVKKVSTVDEVAASGAATFSVTFELDDAARRQLTALLTAARAANVTIKPPPPRQARRYPVEWPVCLGTTRGAVRGEALDVSREGMFVRPTNALSLDANPSFSAVLDDGAGPISGRAKVVRHITEGRAQDAGLLPGYGLHIVDMGRTDYLRWHDFLIRVEKRADKRVLIGAGPGRLAELQAYLAAAGYAVTGSPDPGALLQLASTDARAVDACILDAGWSLAATSAIESLFAAHDVPCMTMQGDARRVRAAIDTLLAIA